jgi:hypothetical protein
MNTNKAAYWIAVGALALGLNSEYRHGSFVALHRVADRAGSASCRMTTRAKNTLAMTMFLARPEIGVAGTQAASTGEAEVVQAREARAEMLPERSQQERSLQEAANLREADREAVREKVRDEVRAHADVIRAHADIRRAEINIGTRSRIRFATVGNRNVTVFCPKTGTWITLDSLAKEMVSPYVEMAQEFQRTF